MAKKNDSAPKTSKKNNKNSKKETAVMTTKNDSSTETATSTTPVYEQFLTALSESIVGLVRKDHKNWVTFVGPSGHKVCVQRAQTRLPRIETSLEVAGGESVEGHGIIRSALKTPSLESAASLFEQVASADLAAPVKAPRGRRGNKEIPTLDSLLAE